MRRFQQTELRGARKRWYAQFFGERSAPTCDGARLRPESARGAGRRRARSSSSSRADRSTRRATFFAALELDGRRAQDRGRGAEGDPRAGSASSPTSASATSRSTAPGPRSRAARASASASRARSGTELTGVIYMLDEPSIGLHQRDNGRLLATLERLRDFGNTVIVVEHDEETIAAADHVVDFGPGAGVLGGRDRARGHAGRASSAARSSLTGAYLSGRRAIDVPGARRAAQRAALKIERRAREQPEGRRRRDPARRADGGDRRLGRRQEHARERDPLPGARARAPPRRRGASGSHRALHGARASSTR